MRDMKVLIRAIEQGDLKGVCRVVQDGIGVNALSSDGQTPLTVAVATGNVDIVKKLLAAGADPNQASGKNGETPLTLATRRGSEELVALLIEGGADINKPNSMPLTPLCLA